MRNRTKIGKGSDLLKDPWNPTQEEILKWAQDKEAICEQDWELAIASFENFELMVNLANDINLEKRYFFLSCLYVFVGDIVRGNEEHELTLVKGLLNAISMDSNSNEITDWKIRSLRLIGHTEEYEYRYWGIGSEFAG